MIEAIILIAFLYIGLLSPILSAWYLALFKGKGVARRWMFPFVAPLIVYGYLLVAVLIFFVPFYLIALDILPGAIASGLQRPFWVPVVEWVLAYDGFIISTVLIAMSIWLVRSLWPRWCLKNDQNGQVSS